MPNEVKTPTEVKSFADLPALVQIPSASEPPAPPVVEPVKPEEVKPVEIPADKPAETEIKKEDKIIDVKFDDFLKAKDELHVKEEDEKKDETKPPVEVKPTKQETKPRDFTGLSDEEKTLFSRMSNEAYEKLLPVYKEHKTLKATISERDNKITELSKGVNRVPESYYENPAAFVLDPSFPSLSNNVQTAGMILEHWQQQLINIRTGKPFVDLNWSPEKKQFVYSEARQATPEDEAATMANINHSTSQLHSVNSKLTHLQETYKSRHDAEVQGIKEAETKYFGEYDKPDHPMKATIATILEHIPVAFRSSPLASMLAKSITANIQLRNLLVEIVNGNKAKGALKEEAKAAGPTAAAIGQAAGKKVDTLGTDIADFEAVKNR